MEKRTLQDLPGFFAVLGFVDSIFRELNMGLFIYHMEDLSSVSSLRLIYANAEASRSTGGDLRNVVGRRIFNAFPNLESTEVPSIFSEVANRKTSRRLENFEYADDKLEKGNYRVRAFPMPNDCVGVLFEKI